MSIEQTEDEQLFEEGCALINPVLAHLTYLTCPRDDGKPRTMADIAGKFIANCQANHADVDLMLEDLLQVADGVAILAKGLKMAVTQQQETNHD